MQPSPRLSINPAHKSVAMLGMVNIAFSEVLRSMGGRGFIHDALRSKCGGIGVEDARIAENCGDEIVLMEAAEQGWKYHSYLATKSDTD